jgi:TRAP-type mannitol/chloroaromatic compound transport system substrate-binding protein
MEAKSGIERRRLLQGAAAAGAAAGATTLSTPAIAQARFEWKMVTTWPKNFPGLGTAANRFAETVSAATDGRLKVKVFAAGELVPSHESFDAITRGAAELMHAAPSYWTGKHKGLAYMSAVPFGLTGSETAAWIEFGGGQQIWDKILDTFGLQGFRAGSTGVQMGGWFNKEVDKVDTIKTLKVRMPGLGGEMLKKLGAAVLDTPGTEIVAGLQSGALDGAEWFGPFNDLALGLHKAAKFYYWPGVQAGGMTLEITVDKKKLTALPKDLQRIFQECCRAEAGLLTAEYDARNSQALETLVKLHNVQLMQFPDDVLIAFGTATGELIQELLDKGDPLTKEATVSYLKARRELMAWGRVAAQGYMNARLLDYKFPTG